MTVSLSFIIHPGLKVSGTLPKTIIQVKNIACFAGKRDRYGQVSTQICRTGNIIIIKFCIKGKKIVRSELNSSFSPVYIINKTRIITI